MAAAIAAGVVRIDSSRHEDPAEVARVSLAIADQIVTQTAAVAEEEEAPKSARAGKLSKTTA